MTPDMIHDLRLAVIAAVRADVNRWLACVDEPDPSDPYWDVIHSVRALDAAEAPDPWALLARVYEYRDSPELWDKDISDALEWKLKHPQTKDTSP